MSTRFDDLARAAATQPAFQAYIPTDTVTSNTMFTYTSQEAPSAPLPADATLLRSFTFTSQGLSATPANYFLYVSFTPVTLAALGAPAVESEEDLDLLYRDGNQWISLLDNCPSCNGNALLARITMQTVRLGEFALVARITSVYPPFIEV